MIVVAIPGFSQSRPCTRAEHLQVEKEAETLRAWDSLYKSYKHYEHCDDVDAAEGYRESIARILTDHWETLPRLSEIIQKDKSFGSFVTLDATMNMADVAKIKELATEYCPAGLEQLCARLKQDADDAIADDANATRPK